MKDIKTDLQSLTLKIKLHIKEKTFIDMLMNQNQTLDGKGSYVDIDWNKFNEVGVKPENLRPRRCCKHPKWVKKQVC